MAPREPFKVHSLSKHIEDTKKGLSAEAQYNRRPTARSSAAIKKEPGATSADFFGDNDDSDESSDSSDSDSDGQTNAEFLKKLGAASVKHSTAPKRRSKSEEIADSDIERGTTAKKAATANKEKNVKQEESSSVSSDESSSESESEAASESQVKTNGVATKASTSTSATSSSGSEESESESESEEEQEQSSKADTARSAAPKPTTNGIAKPAESSSSSEEESDEESEEDSSEDEAPAKAVKSIQKQAETAAENSSSESESSEDDSDDEMADESMHITDRAANNPVATPKFIAPDFVLRKSDDGASGKDVARICNEANLQGKQVWYFTVPANIPISVVQTLEIPMDRSQLGDRIFSHEGQDYGLSFDSLAPKSSIQILIPSADDSNYRPSPQQIDQTMHIKRITSLGSAGSSQIDPAPSRPARPQPHGLKARYQPFGVNTAMGSIGEDVSEGEADVEMAEAAGGAAEKSSKKDKKSKKKQAASEADVQTPKVDRKGKRKHPSSDDDAAAVEEQLQGETKSVESKSKKQKTARTGSPDLGSETPSANRKQTPIVPPTIPPSSFSFSSLGSSAPVNSTPSKPSAPEASVKKSAKKVKIAEPVPSPEAERKVTPVPVPVPGSRQTTVPLPSIPLAARPKESPVPIPSSGSVATPASSKAKRTKKTKDEVKGPGSSQQSPPPSAQSSKKKITGKAKSQG